MTTTTTDSEAGSTAVALHPADVADEPGETITLDVVVENAGDGGVGSHETTVTIEDATVAEITDAELLGNPGQTDIDVSEDGTTVELTAALMDTETNTSVTIAQVEVELGEAGTTAVGLTIDVLSDDAGDLYAVTDTEGTTLESIEDAGDTTVALSPEEFEGGVTGIVRLDVVVEDAGDGGIGSHETIVTLEDEVVGKITDAELLGDPDEKSVDISEDGTVAELFADGMTLDDSGSVTVAHVDVELVESGATTLDLAVTDLFDVEGAVYTVTEADSTALTAVDDLSVDVTDQVSVPGGSATFEIDAILLDALTIDNLWTDWKVTLEDIGDGEVADEENDDDGAIPVEDHEGTIEITWEEVQPFIFPVIHVDVPERYVGGTYLLDVVGKDTEETSEALLVKLEITDE